MITLFKNIPVLSFVLLLGCGITNVDPGNVGVEVNRCSGGGVNQQPLPIGYHFTGPCEDIFEYPVSMQNAAWAGENGIHVASGEGLDIVTEVSLNYTVLQNKAPHIYQKYRKSVEEIENFYMKNLVREAMRREFSKYPANDLYTKQYELQGLVEKTVREELGKDGFTVENLTLNRMQVPDSVKISIEARVAATQNAQKVENEIRTFKATADKQVAQAEGNARAAVIEAEANAKVKKLKADAEAYYINQITKALTSTFVDYTRAQKWDGKLSQVTSGGTNVLDLRK